MEAPLFVTLWRLILKIKIILDLVILYKIQLQLSRINEILTFSPPRLGFEIS